METKSSFPIIFVGSITWKNILITRWLIWKLHSINLTLKNFSRGCRSPNLDQNPVCSDEQAHIFAGSSRYPPCCPPKARLLTSLLIHPIVLQKYNSSKIKFICLVSFKIDRTDSCSTNNGAKMVLQTL